MAANMLSEPECCAILGVAHDATSDEIMAARRRLARLAHPDRGGSHVEMVEINEACRVLLAARARASTDSDVSASRVADRSTSVSPHERHDDRQHEHRRYGFRDAPSFVISALPAEAFEILLVAAANLGEVVDEDPPYLLEVLVRDPGPLWCRFELFPDAGSTTIILSCDVEVGYRVYSVEEIRDLWISTINASSITE
jgi:hypothetical protein